MTIFMKVYLTLLVVSFIMMFVAGIPFECRNERLAYVFILPFPILFFGGLLYGVLYLIWGV